MTTIPERMKYIADDIQNTFEELIKNLLKKTMKFPGTKRSEIGKCGTNKRCDIVSKCSKRFARGNKRTTCYNNSNHADNGYGRPSFNSCGNSYSNNAGGGACGGGSTCGSGSACGGGCGSGSANCGKSARNKCRISRGDTDKYKYAITSASLGWNNDIFASVRTTPKIIKNNVAQRFPVGDVNNYNLSRQQIPTSYSSEGYDYRTSSSNVAFDRYINILTENNINNIIINGEGNYIYNTDIPYVSTFKYFESIGEDIIDQTDSTLTISESATLSTALLRMRLNNLDNRLAQLSVDYPNIYSEYIEMIRIINSVPRNKITWVINLIAAMSYQRWEDLSTAQQNNYISNLGENFICAFNSNEVITILLQSNTSHLIITCSYLYPLLKMLFVVFGYSKLIPIILDSCCNPSENCKTNKGYRFTRASERNQIVLRNNYSGDWAPSCAGPGCDTSNNACSCGANIDCTGCPGQSVCINNGRCTSEPCSKPYVKPDPTDFASCGSINLSNVSDYTNINIEPIDQGTYDYIRLFGELYPTIIGLMGGTEEFPPENLTLDCKNISANYNCLSSVPEYLWRFNDYSYCKYWEHIGSRHVYTPVCDKVMHRSKSLRRL